MFNRQYQDEIHMMSGIINQRVVIRNTLYRMSRDENLKHYLKQVVSYAKSGGSLKVMGFNNHYLIIKQNDSVMKLFRMFISSLLEMYIDKSASDIAKPCSILPDSGGETLLRIIGFMPLLEIVSEHVKTSEFLKDKVSLVDKDSMVEYQRNRLFSKCGFKRGNKFPGDDKFIDYALKNEYIDTLKVDFDENESQRLQEMLLIAQVFENNPTLSNDAALKMGHQFWDAKRTAKYNNDKKTTEMFKNIFTSLIDNVSEDEVDKDQNESQV
jgi:hypothetical protein